MSLYSCRPGLADQGFILTKLDMDLNPEASYEVTNATCTCPAGHRPTCKHRSRLLPAFLKYNHISDGWYLNDLTMMWHRPITLDQIPDDMPISFSKGEPLPASPVTGVSPPAEQAIDYSKFVRRA